MRLSNDELFEMLKTVIIIIEKRLLQILKQIFCQKIKLRNLRKNILIFGPLNN